MIDRTEILRVANTLGLAARVVEKDYVLGWVLHGIARDPLLGASWVFKGGTCLKKCYVETYRFSEDLDFTVLDPTQLDEGFLHERFRLIGAQLYDETGIEIPAALLRFSVWDNPRGQRAGEGRLAYRGPIAPRGSDLPRIKLDLTADEALVLPSVTRPITHAYSDRPAGGMTARCYAFEEVFGEKIRALGERARPRDLYDVINLFRNGEFHAAAALIRDVVRQKCAFKGVRFPTLDALAAFRDELVSEWQNMLGHQLPVLPPVESFWEALPEFFGWLAGTFTPVAVAAYPFAAGDEVIRAVVTSGVPDRAKAVIEVIRFAGANRLCVQIDYVDAAGTPSSHTLEPYSLRCTAVGDLLVHGLQTQDHEPRAFKLEGIRAARVTRQVFAPRYTIELTPMGPLVVSEGR